MLNEQTITLFIENILKPKHAQFKKKLKIKLNNCTKLH